MVLVIAPMGVLAAVSSCASGAPVSKGLSHEGMSYLGSESCQPDVVVKADPRKANPVKHGDTSSTILEKPVSEALSLAAGLSCMGLLPQAEAFGLQCYDELRVFLFRGYCKPG